MTPTFSDEDLQKLKDHIKVHFGDFNGECQLTAEGLEGLVARLESAEAMATPLRAFIAQHGEHHRREDCMSASERTKYDVARERIEAWEKTLRRSA